MKGKELSVADQGTYICMQYNLGTQHPLKINTCSIYVYITVF